MASTQTRKNQLLPAFLTSKIILFTTDIVIAMKTNASAIKQIIKGFYQIKWIWVMIAK